VYVFLIFAKFDNKFIFSTIKYRKRYKMEDAIMNEMITIKEREKLNELLIHEIMSLTESQLEYILKELKTQKEKRDSISCTQNQ